MGSPCGGTDRGLPLQTQSLRGFEQHLNDLKKENFNLKLRIYFLEEKIQQKFEEVSDGVIKKRAVDEKFRWVEKKEEETLRLQLLLREKEREQETITSLEVLLRGQALQVDQLVSAWRNVQQQQQDSEDRQSCFIRERDDIISHLQGALHSSMQEAQAAQEELQAAQEELRLALTREQESQELSRSQDARLDALTRRLHVKEEIIRDLQRQMAGPTGLLVERLTQEVHELRDRLAQQGGPAARSSILDRDLPELGELNSDDEDEADGESISCPGGVDEKGAKRRIWSEVSIKGPAAPGKPPSHHVAFEGLLEGNPLEEELRKEAGFSPPSQRRNTLPRLQLQLAGGDHREGHEEGEQDEEEQQEELDVSIEGAEEDGEEELWDAWEDELPNGIESTLEPSPSSQAGVGREPSSGRQQKRTVHQERLMAVQDQLQLLTVPPDRKQVQVDLQDPGYETCGRSETEAERDDTSSPEFDDLEMCTSLDCGSQWRLPSSWTTQSSAQGDPSSLQRLVQDLRSRLSRSQAVIRDLQSRLLSTSTSSPRRVNWSVQALPPQRGPEEDEGLQLSDGGPPVTFYSDGCLQALVSRVDALEDQLKWGAPQKVREDGKCNTWPGKFDSLVQAQARELSHLRQRLREVRGVSSVLTQQLGDTTRTFEELLRDNDIDFHTSQTYREQLAQSVALAQRLGAKTSSQQSEEPEEKTELLGIRLSTELQQKDQLIESLCARLEQQQPHRSDTPCSQARSDTNSQSDCISYVSDELGSTNDDLDLCSEADAGGEPAQDTSARVSPGRRFHSGTESRHPPGPPSITSSHTAQSWISCPSMQCTSSPPDLQFHAGFSTTPSKPLQGFPLTHQLLDSTFPPLSFHEYQPCPFGSTTSSRLAATAMKAGASLLDSSALWDVAHGNRLLRLGADLSSGSSGYQSGTSHTGSDLMKEHLREIRSLRQRLEDSIQTNDGLRQQLEGRLARTAPDNGAPTNIYIQGLDSVGQLSSEVRHLKEENGSLQKQLQEARESSEEAEQLRQASLKEAELVAERWAGQITILRAEVETRDGEMVQLKQDRQRKQEDVYRLQHEVSVLQQQLCESRRLVLSLQCELLVSHREGGVTTDSETGPTPPVGDPGLSGPSSLLRPTQKWTGASHHHGNVTHTSSDPASDLQDKDASLPMHHGHHVVGHLRDIKALQQRILEGGGLLQKMEATLCSLSLQQQYSRHQASDSGSVRKLLSDTRTLRTVLEEADTLLRMFWIAALPNMGETQEDSCLRDEVASLRLTLSEQERVLRDATEKLRISNRTKDDMERYIVSQLSRTQDVLRRAKTNLQLLMERNQKTLLSSQKTLLSGQKTLLSGQKTLLSAARRRSSAAGRRSSAARRRSCHSQQKQRMNFRPFTVHTANDHPEQSLLLQLRKAVVIIEAHAPPGIGAFKDPWENLCFMHNSFLDAKKDGSHSSPPL